MSRKSKRIILLICIALAAVLLPASVFAVGTIDTEKNVDLVLSCKDNGKAIPGVPFEIYMVAETDKYTAMTLTESFAKFRNSVTGLSDLNDVSEEEWFEIAETLKSKVMDSDISPEANGETGEDGLICVEGLKPGLYLVIWKNRVKSGDNIYTGTSFMMFLPGRDSVKGLWDYNVTVSAKYKKEIVEDDDRTITRKVLKVWDDEGQENKRPGEVVVRLYKNGRLYDSIQLNEKNGWSFRWNDLDPASDWTVSEDDIPGYSSAVNRDGITFYITNTFIKALPVIEEKIPEEEVKEDSEHGATYVVPVTTEKLPTTGLLWWPVPVMLCIGIAFIFIGVTCRRGAEL